MSRIRNTGRNIIWQVLATVLTMCLGLVSRYVFNQVLGANYLGLSSLFAAVLSVLSFADLGLATSFTYCLYKPIAQNDEHYICVLLTAYKKIMQVIMLIILGLGLCFLPFLRYFVAGGEQFDDFHLWLFYLLSLFEVLAGYLCTYKVCYVAACQQEYKIVPIRMGGSVLLTLLKLLAVALTHSYTFYVIVGTVVVVLQQLVINTYIKKKFPIVKQPQMGEVSEEDRKAIKRNMKAALIGKFAQISVNQTDSLIISAVLNIGTLGRITNYATFKGYVFQIVSQIQMAAYASMGNVVATESKSKQLDIFYKYLLVSQILISGAVCSLLILMTPVVVFLFGPDWQVDMLSITLMITAAGIVYHTYALNIIPTVSGRSDVIAKWTFLEGAVNLIVSLIAIQLIGLPGVYVGTLAAEIAYYIAVPQAVFRKIYDCSAKKYYQRTIYGMAFTVVEVIILFMLKKNILQNGVDFNKIVVLCVCVVTVFCGITWIAWSRDKYFKELCALVKSFLRTKYLQK